MRGDLVFSKSYLPSTEEKWLRSEDESQMVDYFLSFFENLNRQRRQSIEQLQLRVSFHTDFRVCSKLSAP